MRILSPKTFIKPGIVVIAILLFLAICMTFFLYWKPSSTAEDTLPIPPASAVPTISTTAVTPKNPTNPHSTLSVPTQITKIDGLYFIVDCYHNTVIYNDNLQDPLNQWSVLTDEINRGHTIAGGKGTYLIDDTENNRVLLYQKDENSFDKVQEIENIGIRPHYSLYNNKLKTFYVWSSMTGELYFLKQDSHSNSFYISDIKQIEKLVDVYVRTITIIDDDIYFVSGNSSIIRASLDTFEILEEYYVPPELAGMVQLEKIQDYFYITVSTDVNGNTDYATIVRANDLHCLVDYEYEDIFEYFDEQGTPYYLGQMDEHWYLTAHRYDGVGIWQFDIINNEIENVILIY